MSPSSRSIFWGISLESDHHDDLEPAAVQLVLDCPFCRCPVRIPGWPAMAAKRWPSAIDAMSTSHSTPKRSMSWSRITASQTRSERVTRPGETDDRGARSPRKLTSGSIFQDRSLSPRCLPETLFPRTHELDHNHPLQGQSLTVHTTSSDPGHQAQELRVSLLVLHAEPGQRLRVQHQYHDLAVDVQAAISKWNWTPAFWRRTSTASMPAFAGRMLPPTRPFTTSWLASTHRPAPVSGAPSLARAETSTRSGTTGENGNGAVAGRTQSDRTRAPTTRDSKPGQGDPGNRAVGKKPTWWACCVTRYEIERPEDLVDSTGQRAHRLAQEPGHGLNKGY